MHPPFEDTPEDSESDEGIESDLHALDHSETYSATADETVQTLLFTATNPAGTISVTVLMGGQILRVELAPRLSMTEGDVAAEITLISTLAQMQARAGQHLVIAALMRRRGQDPAFTTNFLERTLGLPSPETVAIEQHRVFAACYSGDES